MQISHKRHKSHFQKGMTLQQYLLGIQTPRQTLPTACTYSKYSQKGECLYTTSHQLDIVIERPIRERIAKQSDSTGKSFIRYKNTTAVLSNNLINPKLRKIFANPALPFDGNVSERMNFQKSSSSYDEIVKKLRKKSSFSPYKNQKKNTELGQSMKIPMNEEKKQVDKLQKLKMIYGANRQSFFDKIRKSHQQILEKPKIKKGEKIFNRLNNTSRQTSGGHKDRSKSNKKQMDSSGIADLRERLSIKRKANKISESIFQ